MRGFPEWSELNEAQQAFCSLDPDVVECSTTLVQGAAGTGKTIVALHRARVLLEAGLADRVLVLMHNRTLERYVGSQAAALARDFGKRFRVRTWHSWICSWIMHWPNGREFLFDRAEVFGWRYDYPWDLIRDRLADWLDAHDGSIPREREVPHLVIDEGQDMPNGFFALLRDLVDAGLLEGTTITADTRQAITEQASTVEDIASIMGCSVEPDQLSHHQLVRNYRNTRNIAIAARTFVSDDFGLPDLPEARSPEEPVRVRELAGSRSCMEHLARWAVSRPSLRIGVFFRRSEGIEAAARWFNANEAIAQGADGLPRLQRYYRSADSTATDRMALQLDFESPGTITLLCDESVKGLEFDAVFIMGADMRSDEFGRYCELQYVMASRARDVLEYLIASDASGAPSRMRRRLPQADGDHIIWVKAS